MDQKSTRKLNASRTIEKQRTNACCDLFLSSNVDENPNASTRVLAGSWKYWFGGAFQLAFRCQTHCERMLHGSIKRQVWGHLWICMNLYMEYDPHLITTVSCYFLGHHAWLISTVLVANPNYWWKSPVIINRASVILGLRFFTARNCAVALHCITGMEVLSVKLKLISSPQFG